MKKIEIHVHRKTRDTSTPFKTDGRPHPESRREAQDADFDFAAAVARCKAGIQKANAAGGNVKAMAVPHFEKAIKAYAEAEKQSKLSPAAARPNMRIAEGSEGEGRAWLNHGTNDANNGVRYFEYEVGVESGNGMKHFKTIATGIDDVKSQIKEIYGSDAPFINLRQLREVKSRDAGSYSESDTIPGTSTKNKAEAFRKKAELEAKGIKTKVMKRGGTYTQPGRKIAVMEDHYFLVKARDAIGSQSYMTPGKREDQSARLEKAEALRSLIRSRLSSASPEASKLLKEAEGHLDIAIRTLKNDRYNSSSSGTGTAIKLITTANQLRARADIMGGTKDATNFGLASLTRAKFDQLVREGVLEPQTDISRSGTVEVIVYKENGSKQRKTITVRDAAPCSCGGHK